MTTDDRDATAPALVRAILADPDLTDDNKYRLIALAWRGQDPDFDWAASAAALDAGDVQAFERLVFDNP